MKKRIILLGCIMAMMVGLSACGNLKEIKKDDLQKDSIQIIEGNPPDTLTEEKDENDESKSEGKVITPLVSKINIDTLDNCSVMAGFAAKDVYLENDSRLVIRITVYDSEMFDEQAITDLKVGDTIVIGGNSISVNTVEKNEDGYICINGGYDHGGVWLSTSDTGTYYEIQEKEKHVYCPVGNVTIPVAQEFIFRDCNSTTGFEEISYAGDFLMKMENSDRVFSPDMTTVTVADGKISELGTVYEI